MESRDNKLVYALVYVMDYHGGTRGSQLGIYSTPKSAYNSWLAFLKAQDDRFKKEIQKLNGDYDCKGPKILEFTLDAIPTKIWSGKELSISEIIEKEQSPLNNKKRDRKKQDEEEQITSKKQKTRDTIKSLLDECTKEGIVWGEPPMKTGYFVGSRIKEIDVTSFGGLDQVQTKLSLLTSSVPNVTRNYGDTSKSTWNFVGSLDGAPFELYDWKGSRKLHIGGPNEQLFEVLGTPKNCTSIPTLDADKLENILLKKILPRITLPKE